MFVKMIPKTQWFHKKTGKMLCRANFIGICCISGLCILMLIFMSHHSSSPALSAYLLGTEMAEHYNKTTTIEEVIAEQRVKIAAEMKNFEYPAGRFNSTPWRNIVVTSVRSGSTFFGDILNAMPGSIYFFEPLLNVSRETPQDEELHIGYIKNLLNCEFNNKYIEVGKNFDFIIRHNKRLWTVCQKDRSHCWRPEFLTPYCKLFPLQTMKTVRLRLKRAEALLEDER